MTAKQTRKRPEPFGAQNKRIGKRLAQLRNARSITQTDLAKKVGLAQNIVSDFERGRTRLNADALILFAKALNVTADQILGLDSRRSDKELISRPILRRAARLEALPPVTKKHVLRTIDMLLKSAEG